MSYGLTADGYGAVNVPGAIVSEAHVDARVSFIRRTYAHLAGAIFLFIALEYALLKSPLAAQIFEAATFSRYSWAAVLGIFMVVGWVADWWAHNSTSKAMQYAGLILYTVAEVLIFCPLLYFVVDIADQPEIIPMAGIMTLMLFGGLTATVFLTKKDFSFLRGGLAIASMAAMGVIVAGIIWGFHLGLVFSLAMVGLSGAYVLYYTSNVMKHYRTTQHVAAALALFSAIALMFWYIIRVLMELRN